MNLIPQVLLDAVLLGGLYALLSIGLSLAFGVTRIINFTHGEFIMLGAYGAYLLSTRFGLDPLAGLVIVAVLVALIGMLLFKLAIERVLTAPHVNQILLLFGAGLIFENLVTLIMTGDERSVQTAYSLSSSDFMGLSVPDGRVIAFIVSMLLVACLIFWLKMTESGRATRAVAERRDAAVLMGINVRRVNMISFMISSALGAATGVIVSFLLTISPFMGFHMLVKGFAIVVLGGLGSIPGTVIAAFILAFTETGVSYYVPDGSGWAEGVAFAVLLGVLILRPRGIFGQAVEI